jgi:hypothetical protein
MSTDFVSLFTGMSERDIGYLLKNVIQKSINEELTNTEVSNVDEKTPVLITNSKDIELMTDISISSVINIESPTPYTMTEEPDGKDLKIWLKFQNAGELRDYSYQKNKSYAVGSNTMPGLFYRSEPHNMLKSELYTYFNGASHYAYTVDAPPIRILPNITANKITNFFIRLLPITLAKLLYAENNSLFTKVDDDQLRYGYSVTVDVVGSLHFYIKNDYRQYHLWIKDAYNDRLSDPLFGNTAQFRMENFNTQNFMTAYQQLCNIVKEELPFDDWHFKYNPTNHQMTVTKKTENNTAVVVADSATVTPVPILSCPIQEGKYRHDGTIQTTIYDNSGGGFNGSITNITTGGAWQDDNTLLSNGTLVASDGLLVTFPTIAALDSATAYTISFWYKPETSTNPFAFSAWLLDKGYSANGSWIIYRPSGGSAAIRAEFKSSTGSFHTATFNNAFPDPTKWYHIVARFNPSSSLRIFVNGVVSTGSTLPASIVAGSSTLKMYRTTTAANGTIALLKVFTSSLSDSQIADLYYEGYHNPLFPKSENIQPVQEETPDPIFIPFTNVYLLDKMTTPAAADYRKINSLAGSNPLTTHYNVADGTSTTDPEVEQYNVPDGVTTGGGGPTEFTLIYNCTDPGTNSFVQLAEDQNNAATAVEISSSGSSLIGKKVTKAVFYLRGINSPTGTVKCYVWNASGSVVTELWYNGTLNNRLNAANVDTDAQTPYTFQNTDLTPWGSNTMQMGWKVGIEYDTGGSTNDQIRVKRDQGNPKSGEWANARDYNGNWDDNVDADDLVGQLYEGGTGTPTVEPWYVMSNSYITAELIGSTSPLKSKKPTRIRFKVKRNSSATSGTLSLIILNTSNVSKGTLTTWNVSSLTTATGGADLTWQNVNQDLTIENGEQIGLFVSGMPTGGTVSVMTNKGNNTTSDPTKNHNSTTSYLRKRTASSWTNDTSSDVSGNIYTGGNDFDAYLRFSETRTRVATKAVNNQSSLHNKKITKVTARIKKVGAPSGIIQCRIRDPNDVQRVLYSSVDVSTITADSSYHDVVFENYLHNYLINSATGSGDKIVFEYSGAGTSNYIEFNSNKDVFDTSNLATIAQTYDNGNYVDQSQRDLAGKLESGGEPDLNSRTRVAQSIEHQNSRLKGKKITRIKQYLYRTNTNVSGTVYCNIRRGTDDSLVKTIDTVAASTLSTNAAAPTFVEFEDTTNNYPLTVDDKVCIEFNGGNSTDQVGVLVRTVDPNYDGTNSIVRKFNEANWDDAEVDKDLCATMDEGGFFFTPDPNAIPDPTPVNDKDLIFAAGNNKLSGFFETFLMEFRIYTKDITLDMANYLYENRYSISPISPGQILMPFSLKISE